MVAGDKDRFSAGREFHNRGSRNVSSLAMSLVIHSDHLIQFFFLTSIQNWGLQHTSYSVESLEYACKKNNLSKVGYSGLQDETPRCYGSYKELRLH